MNKSKRIVYLEIGIGYNTPTIIRYPFESLTNANENATLIRINKDYPQAIEENINKTISFAEDTIDIVNQLSG